MPVQLAPPGSTPEVRLTAIEKALRDVSAIADGALQIPLQMRGGTPGQALAGGKPLLDPQGLIAVASVIINGGSQTVGPITGVAAPPTGLGGTGGEVVLTTATFTLPRQETVWMLAICSDYVLSTVGFTSTHPVYFQVDTVDSTTAYAVIPVWASPGNAETRAHSATISLVTTLAAGKHTVNVIWNSRESANDTCFNTNNPLFVFQLGN